MNRRRIWTLLVLALLALAIALPVSANGDGTALFGESVSLEAGDVHEGDLVLFGGELTTFPGSVVNGDVAVVGGSADLDGEVTGSVSVVGGSLSLGSHAVVGGDVVVAGDLLYRDANAVIEGSLIEGMEAAADWDGLPGFLANVPWANNQALEPGTELMDAPTLPQNRAAGGLGALFVLLLVAALLIKLLPENVEHISHVMTSSMLLTTGVGVLTLMLGGILVPVLLVICIGAPVAVVLGLALVVCALLGWVAAGQVVGEWFFKLIKHEGQTQLVNAVVGTAVIVGLGWIPCLGALFALFVSSWGVGAAILTKFGATVDPIWSPSPVSSGTSAKAPANVSTEPAAQDSMEALMAKVSTEPSKPRDTHPLDLSQLEEELLASAEDDIEDAGGKGATASREF